MSRRKNFTKIPNEELEKKILDQLGKVVIFFDNKDFRGYKSVLVGEGKILPRGLNHNDFSLYPSFEELHSNNIGFIYYDSHRQLTTATSYIFEVGVVIQPVDKKKPLGLSVNKHSHGSPDRKNTPDLYRIISGARLGRKSNSPEPIYHKVLASMGDVEMYRRSEK